MANRDARGRFLPAHSEAGPGRSSTYEPWMADQAHRLALLGLNDEEIAHAFGISHDTFYKWFKKHDAFAEAILAGKERADADVAFSLYQRAKGVTVISEKAFKGAKGDVVVAETRTQLPGDVRAAEIWLRNRQRKRWAKPEDMPADPEGEKALADMSDEDLERRRAEIEARLKESGEG